MSKGQFWLILFGIIAGAILGYYGNVLANKKNNELLVQLLQDQLNCTEDEITSGRASTDRLDYLVNRKRYLEENLNYYSKKFNIYT